MLIPVDASARWGNCRLMEKPIVCYNTVTLLTRQLLRLMKTTGDLALLTLCCVADVHNLSARGVRASEASINFGTT